MDISEVSLSQGIHVEREGLQQISNIMYMQKCGNIQPTAGLFDLFLPLISCSPYTMLKFQYTRHPLDLLDNVLCDWLFTHYCVYTYMYCTECTLYSFWSPELNHNNVHVHIIYYIYIYNYNCIYICHEATLQSFHL